MSPLESPGWTGRQQIWRGGQKKRRGEEVGRKVRGLGGGGEAERKTEKQWKRFETGRGGTISKHKNLIKGEPPQKDESCSVCEPTHRHTHTHLWVWRDTKQVAFKLILIKAELNRSHSVPPPLKYLWVTYLASQTRTPLIKQIMTHSKNCKWVQINLRIALIAFKHCSF